MTELNKRLDIDGQKDIRLDTSGLTKICMFQMKLTLATLSRHFRTRVLLFQIKFN